MSQRAVASVKKLWLGATASPTRNYLNAVPREPKERTRLELIQKDLQDPVLRDIIQRIMQNEHRTSAFPSYHAMKNSIYGYPFFTEMLLSLAYPQQELPRPPMAASPLLRFPNAKPEVNSPEELHAKNFPLEHSRYDHQLGVKEKSLPQIRHPSQALPWEKILGNFSRRMSAFFLPLLRNFS